MNTNTFDEERENLKRVCEQQQGDVTRYAVLTQKLRLLLQATYLLAILAFLASAMGWIPTTSVLWALILYVAPPSSVVLAIWFFYDRKRFRIESGLRTNQAKLNATPTTSGTFPRSR